MSYAYAGIMNDKHDGKESHNYRTFLVGRDWYELSEWTPKKKGGVHPAQQHV